ncbi:unnamed protein product [Penicillium discolor]
MESMTRAPHLLMGSRDGWTYGTVEVLDHMAYDGLTDAYDRESMGASTERHNARYELTREAQDQVAALSHQRAAAAQESDLGRRLRRRRHDARDGRGQGLAGARDRRGERPDRRPGQLAPGAAGAGDRAGMPETGHHAAGPRPRGDQRGVRGRRGPLADGARAGR